jgi:hypothetical protein
MRMTSDRRYYLFPGCAICAVCQEAVAVWQPWDFTPHSDYPATTAWLLRYHAELPPPVEPTFTFELFHHD